MNRDILRLAVPNIISNITVPLLGLVDLALMGHLNSELYIGAIALGGVIFNFIYWGFGFLRMSTSGFAAQAYGEKNKTEAITVLVRALADATSTGLFIIAVQLPVAWLGFELIGGSGSNCFGLHAKHLACCHSCCIRTSVLLPEPLLGKPCFMDGHGAFHVFPWSSPDFSL
jgi:Na+-driven multidrug efflux pump